MRIRDGDSSDPGWKKVGSGIRDKHPESATLLELMDLNPDPGGPKTRGSSGSGFGSTTLAETRKST